MNIQTHTGYHYYHGMINNYRHIRHTIQWGTNELVFRTSDTFPALFGERLVIYYNINGNRNRIEISDRWIIEKILQISGVSLLVKGSGNILRLVAGGICLASPILGSTIASINQWIINRKNESICTRIAQLPLNEKLQALRNEFPPEFFLNQTLTILESHNHPLNEANFLNGQPIDEIIPQEDERRVLWDFAPLAEGQTPVFSVYLKYQAIHTVPQEEPVEHTAYVHYAQKEEAFHPLFAGDLNYHPTTAFEEIENLIQQSSPRWTWNISDPRIAREYLWRGPFSLGGLELDFENEGEHLLVRALLFGQEE